MKTKILLIASLLLTMIPQAPAQILNEDGLYGLQFGRRGVRIQVPSGGCTSKGSFQALKGEANGTILLTFKRIEPDRCLALLPYGLTLTYSFEELGLQSGDKVVITNALIPVEILDLRN